MSLEDGASLEAIKELYEQAYHDFEMFGGELESRCTLDGDIAKQKPNVIYTFKKRMKAWESLSKKIRDSDRCISQDNFFYEISDLLGMRIVVLHPSQIELVHHVIQKNVDAGRWKLREVPKAYEGDHRFAGRYEELGFSVEVKSSYYTSVHYLVEQSSDSRICAEIQVRTLFEEVWGEVEHYVRYKSKVEGEGCDVARVDDEMRVLSYIITTGRAHLDLVFNRVN